MKRVALLVPADTSTCVLHGTWELLPTLDCCNLLIIVHFIENFLQFIRHTSLRG